MCRKIPFTRYGFVKVACIILFSIPRYDMTDAGVALQTMAFVFYFMSGRVRDVVFPPAEDTILFFKNANFLPVSSISALRRSRLRSDLTNAISPRGSTHVQRQRRFPHRNATVNAFDREDSRWYAGISRRRRCAWFVSGARFGSRLDLRRQPSVHFKRAVSPLSMRMFLRLRL